MRIGILVLPTDPWPETLATVQHIERLGYHHVWTYDHLSWRRYHDRPWHATYPWLTGIAASTTTIRIGTMVSNPNIRHPLTLAKDAMTIDHISNGRLTVGLGAGGTGYDATVIGQPELTPTDRFERLEEYAGLLDRLLRGSTDDHHGDHYRVNDPRMIPGCVQSPRVPIAIAAGGPRGLRLAAEVADAWITYGDTTYQDLSADGTKRIVREQMGMLEQRCVEIDRDPSEVNRIYLIGNTGARPLVSVEAFGDFVNQYEQLGFTDLVFHQPRPDDPLWNDDPEIIDQIAAAHLRADPTGQFRAGH